MSNSFANSTAPAQESVSSPPSSLSTAGSLTWPTGHVFIGTSLDGFIARPDGTIDWLVPFSSLGEDHGFDAYMASMDGVIMGRRTFEAIKNMDPWIYTKPVWVLSQSLKLSELSERLKEKVEVMDKTAREVMEEAGRRGWKKVYVDGGMVIQSFLKEGLIDDMEINRVPVLVGKGVPLFGELETDLKLEHVSTRCFPSGLVQSIYRVLKE